MKFAAAMAATLAALPLAINAQEQPDGRALAAACAMCHGTDGRSLGGAEALAGMPKAELVRKMNEFRTGAKPATVMHQLSKGYTEAQIQALADHFAAQRGKK